MKDIQGCIFNIQLMKFEVEVRVLLTIKDSFEKLVMLH